MHLTVVAHVEDNPGVLERIASQFRRRSFNIVSVSAGHNAPGISCITVVVDSDKRKVDRVIASISKLVNVLQVQELGDRSAVARDMMLVKVASAGGGGAILRRLIEAGQGRAIDAGEKTTSVEITGTTAELDDIIRELETHGIIEMVRTGAIALAQGDETLKT